MAIMPTEKRKDVSFYNADTEASIKRKRAMAERLLEQSNTPLDTQMVGKYAVERSPVEFINQATSKAYGDYLGIQADKDQGDYLSNKQRAIGDALSSKDSRAAIGVLAQDPSTQDAAVKLYAENLKNGGSGFGVQSQGFEGDIARSMYVLNDPEASEESKNRAKAVISTAQSLKGSWNPVTGAWAANQGRYLDSMQSQGGILQDSMGGGIPQQMPQPTMQAPQSGLLPPPDMSGAPQDASMFQGQQPQVQQSMQPMVGAGVPSNTMPFQSTGNPKLDQARLEAQVKAQIDLDQARNMATQTAQTDAMKDLPRLASESRRSMDVIDQALASKGLESSVGGTFGMLGRQSAAFPVTEAQRNFQPLVDQIKGQSFLQAFQSLKGGGAITEIEGQKAEQAIARLNQAQSPEAFKSALTELRDIIKGGVERAERMSQGNFDPNVPASGSSNPFSGMSDQQLRERIMRKPQ